MTVAQQRQAAGITWRHLLRYAAIADLLVMAVVGIAVRDKEALAFAGAILIGIAFLSLRSARAGVIRVEMRNTAFLQKTLDGRSGSISVAVVNHDLFWHTFTIDALHVNVDVPIGANRRVAFNAPPGNYEFYCRVPGHRAAGMHGILTVS